MGFRPLPGLFIFLYKRWHKKETDMETFSSPSGAFYFSMVKKLLVFDMDGTFSSPSGAFYFSIAVSLKHLNVHSLFSSPSGAFYFSI